MNSAEIIQNYNLQSLCSDIEPLLIRDIVNVDSRVINQLSNIAKYEVYIDRQRAEVEATKKYESIKIPNDMEYKKIKGLSNEILTKLELIRPTNLLQASRIEGVTPAAMTLLNLHIKRMRVTYRST